MRRREKAISNQLAIVAAAVAALAVIGLIAIELLDFRRLREQHDGTMPVVADAEQNQLDLILARDAASRQQVDSRQGSNLEQAAIAAAVAEKQAAPINRFSLNAKPFFGVELREADSSRVTTLYAGSTAAKLGVRIGDRLLAINDRKITGPKTLNEVLEQMRVGTATMAVVLRDGEALELGPAPLQAAAE